MVKLSPGLLQQLLLSTPAVLAAITVDIDNQDSVKAAAAQVADDLMSSFYHGDEPGAVVGILPGPPTSNDPEGYYWWTGGELWASLLELRSHTGENKYDSVISEGLQFQTGENADFLPANWTATAGNDDQGFWAHAAIIAKESGFADAGSDKPQWLTLAQNVFDEQAARLLSGEGNCSGVLRWQLFAFNNGYNYVNTLSNALFFNLGARLAHVTNNQTFADTASKTYDALSSLGLVTDDYEVYDGIDQIKCEDPNKFQFSSNAGTLLEGAAYMYNKTGDDTWKTRLDGLVDRTIELFFPGGVATEVSCEKNGNCNKDMYFYKGILHRSLSTTMRVAPYTAAKILPVLKSSAKAAASTCTGGDNGRMCGYQWADGKFQDDSNAGTQLSVLNALVSVLQTTNVQSSTTGTGGASGTGSSTSSSPTGSGTAGSMGSNVGVSVLSLIGGLLASSLII
ncbi:hypothetical protein JX266_010087 [Neoarthrinium moseri]|nr:hypothetical protein JX266_010087 [Neoarthrinium moseri]